MALKKIITSSTFYPLFYKHVMSQKIWGVGDPNCYDNNIDKGRNSNKLPEYFKI